MNPPYMPDGEMVAQAYITGLGQLFSCSTELPSDPTEWEEHGYIRVAGVVGGSVNPYTGVRSSVVQIESYAYRSDGAFPPRWLASQNLQYVIQTCTVGQQISFDDLVMPDDYYGAALMECYALSDARIRPGDQAGYACYLTEFNFVWFPLDIVVPSPTPCPGPGPDPDPDLPNLVFPFPSPSMSWTVTHNLGYYAVAVLFDDDENEMEAEIHHVDVNTFTVTFSQPTSGTVVVSR